MTADASTPPESEGERADGTAAEPPLEVVGFDLGHGETSFALLPVQAHGPPEILSLHGRRSQVTALARHPALGTLIGEQALQQPDVTSFEIGFKGRPDRDPPLRAAVRDFAGACYQLLVDSRQIRGGRASGFYVGCPSGWSREERKGYAALLDESGIPRLTVVPESRAALLHAKDSGKVTMEELRTSVLVVDIGSSTTDFTLVEFGRENQVDFGADLGGAAIDEGILDLSLEEASDGARLRALLDAHPLLHSRCALACRRAKEEFFSNEDAYSGDDRHVEARLVRLQDAGVFEPRVRASLLRQVVERPLAALDGRSWREALRHQLERAREACRAAGREPAVVLMTGGASRMRFCHDVCEEVFANARHALDPEPEFCISRGLARWGRVDQRSHHFLAAVRAFCDDTIPATLDSHRTQLPEQLARPLTDALLEQVVSSGLKRWREGGIATLRDLETRLAEDARGWLESTAGKALVAHSCASWFRPIQESLAVGAERICLEYQLPGGALQPKVRFDATVPDLPGVDRFTHLRTVGDAGAVVVAFAVAALLGGQGIALLLGGPIGLLVGFIIGLLPGKFVRGLVEDQVRRLDLPVLVRRALVTDARVQEACERSRPELEKELRARIAEADAPFRAMIDSVTAQLRADLEARAQTQLAWIQ